jgi:hypothetical protein
MGGNVKVSPFSLKNRFLAAGTESAPDEIQTSVRACLKGILKGKTMESFPARGGHEKLVKIAIDCQRTCFFALSSPCGRHRIGPGRATDLCNSLFERYFKEEDDGIVSGPGRALQVGQKCQKLRPNE